MRIIVTLAAAAVVGLVFSAPAEAAKKKKYKHAVKPYRAAPLYRAPRDTGWTSYEPEDYAVGSTGWWRAMDRQQRGGFRSS